MSTSELPSNASSGEPKPLTAKPLDEAMEPSGKAGALPESSGLADQWPSLRDYAKTLDNTAVRQLRERALAIMAPIEPLQRAIDAWTAPRVALGEVAKQFASPRIPEQFAALSNFEAMRSQMLAQPLGLSEAAARLVEEFDARTASLASYQHDQDAWAGSVVRASDVDRWLVGSKVTDMLAEHTRRWTEPFSAASESVARMIRQIEENTAQARLAVGAVNESFAAVSKMAQSEDFLRWASELTQEGVDQSISEWLRSVGDESVEDLPATGNKSRKRVAMPPMVAEFLADPNHRVAFLTLLLTLFLHLQSSFSGDQSQAEILRAVAAQDDVHQAELARRDEQIANLLHVVESLQALEALSHRYIVTACVSALRTEPNGRKFDHLERGDEVLALGKAGRWRLISVIDEHGHEIQGWVLAKHLQAVEQ